MKLTEEKIELVVERSMNGLDRELLEGKFTQEQYDIAVLALNRWAEEMYERLKRGGDIEM